MALQLLKVMEPITTLRQELLGEEGNNLQSMCLCNL